MFGQKNGQILGKIVHKISSQLATIIWISCENSLINLVYLKKRSKLFGQILTKIDQIKDYWSKKWDFRKMSKFFWFFGHNF